MEEFRKIDIDDCRGYNHGTGVIDLRHLGKENIEMRPVEIHLKTDGAHSGPSITIISKHALEERLPMVISQISLEMLNKGLKEIGYQITPLI